MNERISKCLVLLLILALGVGGVVVVLASLAMADSVAVAKTLDRDLEPVIMTGTAVSVFAGVPVDELFVYAHTEGVWRHIPAQVDEVTATGAYTTAEDGLLDANDEIVFMAMDLGDQAPAAVFITSTLPVSDTWYQIEVTDPLSPTKKGWAYLFRSSVLTPTFASDYVDFDEVQHRINGQSYSLGFGTTHPGFEYLALGDGGVNILDRTKIRMYSAIPFLPPQTEDTLGPLPDDLIKDGPVRVIVRGGKGLAYGSMVLWNIHIPKLTLGYRKAIRFSTDFSHTASGSSHYNAVVTEGMIVDGLADAVPTTPLSSWWQLSTDNGTIIQVGNTTSIGGEQINYYLDNSTLDPEDTGDKQSYGDIGVHITDPNRIFIYAFALYSLAGTQPNIGATYEAYFMQPLSVATFREGLSVMLEAVPESLTVHETSILTATVLDYGGNPISDRALAFTIVSGQAAVTPTIATTDEAGRATASLSSQVAGSVVAKATVDSVDSNSKIITFTPGAVAIVTLEAAPERLTVHESSTLTSTVLDQYSNPINGINVTFTIVSGQGTVTPTIATTDDAGQATASLSSQVAGSVVVKATADSVDSASKTLAFLRDVYLPVIMKSAAASSPSPP
jgi:hypothetical protein